MSQTVLAPIQSLTEATLDVYAKLAPNILDTLAKTRGIECRVWFPVGNPSVYGTASDRITYNDAPDWAGPGIFQNIFAERYESEGAFVDIFVGAPPTMFSKSDQVFPRKSRVEINLRVRKLDYTLIKVLGEYGNEGLIFRKYEMQPRSTSQ